MLIPYKGNLKYPHEILAEIMLVLGVKAVSALCCQTVLCCLHVAVMEVTKEDLYTILWDHFMGSLDSCTYKF